MELKEQNITEKRRKTWFIVWGVAFVLLLAGGLYYYLFFYVNREKVQKAWVDVKVVTYYELMQDGKMVLDFEHDTVTAKGYFSYLYKLAPIGKGIVISNIAPSVWKNKYFDADCRMVLQCMTDSLDSVYSDSKWKVNELNYYLHSHKVTDEGYNMISQYTQREIALRDTAKKMLDSLTHISKGRKLRIVCKRNVLTKYGKLNILGNNMFQLASKKTPDAVSPLPMATATSLANLSLILWKPSMSELYFHTDSISNYEGEVDSMGCPNGHGKWIDLAKGTYYEGNWKHGKRNGFGFSVARRKILRAGEWVNDVYKGERLVYSSDRIYGIDISKYQHVIGKKKYPINWSQLCITHLGNISKKRVSGTVNYPIRFIYIKSTEGTTLLNPYYRKDYQAARAHGFKVGSYHFFSTLSPALKQAQHFVKHTFVRKGDFPPVLDVEPTPQQIKKMGGTGVLFARVRTWLNYVERQTGVRPILYISQTFVNRYLNQAPDLKQNYHIWIARYGEYKPDIRLVYWQLCPDGRVAGIHGKVDINVFNGYQDAYDKFVKDHAL
jgi:lysozyme